MKINFLRNLPVLNFGSTELYKAKLKQRLFDCEEAAPVDVFITRLEDVDIYRLKRAEKDWEDTRYGGKIIEEFECSLLDMANILDENTVFYAIEVPMSNGEKQIRALAQVSGLKPVNKLSLNLLQVNNDPCMPDILQGAGSCLLYAVINMAKKCGFENFSLFSNTKAKGFYKHNHLRNRKGNEFYLTKSLYDKILSMLKEKYSIEATNKEEPLL